MVRPHIALTAQEKRVERLATRYSADPINLRLLKRLWLTPSALHHVDDLAPALDATPATVRRALGTLARDGLVEERGDENGTLYIVATGLSAHGVVGQLIARHADSTAQGGGAP
jgi:Fic family protein